MLGGDYVVQPLGARVTLVCPLGALIGVNLGLATMDFPCPNNNNP